MTHPYAPGSTIPVQPWLIENIQRKLGHKREGVRKVGLYEQFLVQRFGAWRVFPVRTGRWVREAYAGDLTDDLLSLLLAPVLIPSRAGRWKADDSYSQVLDPSTGAPIAEHVVFGIGGAGSHEDPAWRGHRELAILGDPRVGGLISQVDASSYEQVHTAHRRGKSFTTVGAANYDQVAAQLVNEPYRDFTSRDDGPWLADQPQKPQGHTNGWKPSPWYRPQG